VVLGLLILFGFYRLTGKDPFGLFTEQQATPPNMIGSGADWWQVFFTDPSTASDPNRLAGSIPERLIAHISAAQRTIHVAAFEFDLLPVAEALIAAEKRGVEVRWVTDDEYGMQADADEGARLFAKLRRGGGQVKDDAGGALMHNKFWVFDDQTVWTGSANVTANDNFHNNNNVIVIQSQEVAAAYEREFAELWSGEFGPTSPSTLSEQTVTVDGTRVEVLFAPEDRVSSRLIPLVNGAQHSIRFMAFAFTHERLAAAVQARAKAGVDVKGIFETRDSDTEFSQLSTLFCAGVDVRQDGNPRMLHHKVFIVDDHTIVTGSFNFSENADRNNDENVVIITHPEIAAQYLAEFERRWAEATTPGASSFRCP
jgi:phosphatidylserine/phosphatidylglycerophosphate/cardiolipin synthase-like enzyme